MLASYDDLIFAFDFSRIETVAGIRYLVDYSKNGFHFAFPGGAADPTPQLDGSLLFDGGDYLSLPAAQLARFYAQMPTAQWTALACAGYITNAVGNSPRLFSCWNSTAGGTNRGITIQFNVPIASVCRGMSIVGHGLAALDYIIGALGAPYMPLGRGVGCWTNETTPRGMQQQSNNVYTWGAGAYAAAVYDAAIVPRIGMDPAATNPINTGRLYYLALLRGALSSPDLAELSRLMSEGVQKPFCIRT